MTAELIAVGTELLLGEILNTDSQFLAQQLSQLGINLFYQTVVGDNKERLCDTIKTALSRSDIIITSGGLGPTNDDITKEMLAEAMGVSLELDDESLCDIKSYFAYMNRTMPDSNIKQAYMPQGCIVLKNNNGTAPGGIIEKDGKIAIFLPGPPNELVPMYNESVLPYLYKKSDSVLFSKTLKIIGMGESSVEEMLFDFMKNSTNPTVAPYAKANEVTLRITAKAKDKEEAKGLIGPAEEYIRKTLGECVYGADDDTIYSVVCDMLNKKNMKVSFAESCTGGLLAQSMTSVSGASKVFEQSFVTYSCDAKMKLLNVDEKILEKYGAVSELCAIQMASGALNASGADVAISVTGVAGPGSDERNNPVGLVYIGIADKNFSKAYKFNFMGDREKIRVRACTSAFDILRKYLMNN